MQNKSETTIRFDAVAESRKWKEAVARETKGMTIAKRMGCFQRHSGITGIHRKKSAGVTAVPHP